MYKNWVMTPPIVNAYVYKQLLNAINLKKLFNNNFAIYIRKKIILYCMHYEVRIFLLFCGEH